MTIDLKLTTELRHLPSRQRARLCELLDATEGWKEIAAIIPKPDGQPGFLFSSSMIRTLEQQKTVPGASSSQALIEFWSTSGRKRPTLKDLVETLSKCRLYRTLDFVASDILKMELNHNENEREDIPASLCSNARPQALPSPSSPRPPDCNLNFLVSGANLPLHSSESNNLDSSSNNESLNFVKPTAPAPSTTPSEAPTCSLYVFDQHRETLPDYSSVIPRIPYEVLKEATENFTKNKLGEGAFGAVYMADLRGKGTLDNFGCVAVKIIKDGVDVKQFTNELQIMVKFHHENLLSLFAITTDGSSFGLISPYMRNGSLQDRLACKDSTEPLDWKTRLNIMMGVARGIHHLHTFDGKPFVHRDVKSANILLDENLSAKVADFGLAKIGSACSGATTTKGMKTMSVIGTSVYMAPEAFRGDVSVKLDTFSFGVVLLELLTGLPPYDESRDEPDILSFVDETMSEGAAEESQDESSNDAPDEEIFVSRLIDSKAGGWDLAVARAIYSLSREATQERKKNRPTMIEILPKLEAIISNYT